MWLFAVHQLPKLLGQAPNPPCLLLQLGHHPLECDGNRNSAWEQASSSSIQILLLRPAFSLGYLNYRALPPANTVHAYNPRLIYSKNTRITNGKTIKTLNFRNIRGDAKSGNIRRALSLACASNFLKPALFPNKIHLPLMCLVAPHLIF